MTRINQVQNFIEYDLKNNFIIEPEDRYNDIRENLLNLIKSYNPEVIVKAGIGNGKILLDIASEFNFYLVVVEPSFSAITNFRIKYKENKTIQKIRFINGDFHEFPVDYYASDLIICIDYLDFFDSGKSIDEFKRALQFDGIFFLASVVLNNNDKEGIYDDFIRLIFPLHNDYYLQEDAQTFLELKEFKLVNNKLLSYEKNLHSKINFFQSMFKNISKDEAVEFIKSRKEKFSNILNMNDSYAFPESYYIGVYKRLKPKTS